MDTTNKLIGFAAECEDMAKTARSDHEMFAWRDLAQRWRRCAETSRIHGVALPDAVEGRRPSSRRTRL